MYRRDRRPRCSRTAARASSPGTWNRAGSTPWWATSTARSASAPITRASSSRVAARGHDAGRASAQRRPGSSRGRTRRLTGWCTSGAVKNVASCRVVTTGIPARSGHRVVGAVQDLGARPGGRRRGSPVCSQASRAGRPAIARRRRQHVAARAAARRSARGRGAWQTTARSAPRPPRAPATAGPRSGRRRRGRRGRRWRRRGRARRWTGRLPEDLRGCVERERCAEHTRGGRGGSAQSAGNGQRWPR